MKIKSVLIWPAEKDGGPCLGWHESCENKSEDTHHSESAAKAICETLMFKGFGCDGKIFPLEGRVEVVGDDGKTEIVYRWNRSERRPSIDKKDELSKAFSGFSGFKFPTVELYAPK